MLLSSSPRLERPCSGARLASSSLGGAARRAPAQHAGGSRLVSCSAAAEAVPPDSGAARCSPAHPQPD